METVRATFATIPQVLAAMLAIVGAFAALRLAWLGPREREATSEDAPKLARYRALLFRLIAVAIWLNVTAIALTVLGLLLAGPIVGLGAGVAYGAMLIGYALMIACFAAGARLMYALIEP